MAHRMHQTHRTTRKKPLFCRSGAIACAAVLALYLLSGCTDGSTASEQQPPAAVKIGVSVYDQYDTFISTLMGYFRAAVQEAQQENDMVITVIEESAGGTQSVQNNQVSSFIEAGCDVICVNLVDRADASAIIDMAKAADTKVVFFNRELVEDDLARWDKLYYVGAPAQDSGRIQGEIVISECMRRFNEVDKNGDGALQYVMLEGEAGHQDAIVRTEYSIATVADAGYDLQRLEGKIANWNRDQAKSWMDEWLKEYGKRIEVVFANNDDMALGAIDALEKSEMPQNAWPVVVGIDGTPVGLAAVKEGKMAGTVYNDAEGQAVEMFRLAFALSQNGEPPEDMQFTDGNYVRLPYKKVTRANVDDFLA